MAEEKKEPGKFKKFFQNVGKNISDANRENKLESKYKEDASEFNIYSEGAFGCIVKYGKLVDDTHAEIYGELKEDEIPYSSVLVIEPKDKDKELPKFFYVLEAAHAEENVITLKIKEKVDDKEVENEYQRPLTILTLDADIKEVHVVKVHGKYILCKDKEEVK